MSDEARPDLEVKDDAEWLDQFLVNLSQGIGAVRVTGWSAVVEGFDEDGQPFLWHMDMPGQPTWRKEGILRAALDECKAEAQANRLANELFDDGEE